MTTMFNRKRSRNPSWIRLFARRIGNFWFYRSLGQGWRESWETAGKTL